MNEKELEKEIERLQNLLIEQRQKNQFKLPRAREKGIYYYIDDYLNADEATEDFTLVDNDSYDEFNYFTDENKAQKYADHIKLQLELFQIRDIINDDWIPDWNNEDISKYVLALYSDRLECFVHWKGVSPLAFPTEEKLNKFKELVGENKIKQYLSF